MQRPGIRRDAPPGKDRERRGGDALRAEEPAQQNDGGNFQHDLPQHGEQEGLLAHAHALEHAHRQEVQELKHHGGGMSLLMKPMVPLKRLEFLLA